MPTKAERIAHHATDGQLTRLVRHIIQVTFGISFVQVHGWRGNLIADSTADELKSQTQQSTLEDVFRKLTNAEDTDPGVARIVESLRL